MKKSLVRTLCAFILACSSISINAANPLDAITGLVSQFTSTSNFEISDIAGTWSYQSPAVSFKSGDALSKIGGAAASTALESKLTSYYNAAGLNTLVITINEDSTFTMKVRSISLTGTLNKDGNDGALVFNFSAFGKINIGSVAAMAEKSATNNLTLTFDASKVISIVDKVAAIANVSSIKTLASLLNSYDGLYAGARLKKTGSASSTSSGSPNTSTTQPSSTSTSTSSESTSKAVDALKGLFGK